MLRRRSNTRQYVLSPAQRRTITEIADCLQPRLRNSFLLRVSHAARLNATHGFVPDAIIARAIDGALRQLQVLA